MSQLPIPFVMQVVKIVAPKRDFDGRPPVNGATADDQDSCGNTTYTDDPSR